jgi:hypothetical protein
MLSEEDAPNMLPVELTVRKAVAPGIAADSAWGESRTGIRKGAAALLVGTGSGRLPLVTDLGPSHRAVARKKATAMAVAFLD